MIKLQLNKNREDTENEDLKLQFLPATIKEDGPANVDTYFNNYTKEENGHLSNALRGYPLQGEVFELPKGFKGLVYQESRRPLDENADRVFKERGTFDKFTYWNYDKVPAKGDALRQAMQFVDVAQELAEPVTWEEVEAEMQAHEEKLKN